MDEKPEPPCKTGSQCTTKCMECAEPTPVAWLYIEPDNPHLNVHYDDVDVSQFPHDEWFPVYKQPKREPLTDEQMEQIHQQYGGNIKKIMRAVEAAHGIKGEA